MFLALRRVCAAKMKETHNVMSRMCVNATVCLLFSSDQTLSSQMYFLHTSFKFRFAFVVLWYGHSKVDDVGLLAL